MYTNTLKPERENKHHNTINGDKGVLGFPCVRRPSNFRLLGLFRRVCNARVWVADQQILPVGTIGREYRVVDGDPAGQDAAQPDDRRPVCVRQQRYQRLLSGVVLVVSEIPVHTDRNGSNGKHDVNKVQVALAIPDGHFQASPQRCSKMGISFVELSLL